MLFGVGLNPQGDLVGQYRDAGGRSHGFLLEDGAFTTIDFPAPGVIATVATAINPRGDIVGRYRDAAGKDRGYLLER